MNQAECVQELLTDLLIVKAITPSALDEIIAKAEYRQISYQRTYASVPGRKPLLVNDTSNYLQWLKAEMQPALVESLKR